MPTTLHKKPKSLKGKKLIAERGQKPIVRAFVPTSALAKSLAFDQHMMHVRFIDGRELRVPLAWFPRLVNASQATLAKYEIAGGGISLHWHELDEDLCVANLLAGTDLNSR